MPWGPSADRTAGVCVCMCTRVLLRCPMIASHQTRLLIHMAPFTVEESGFLSKIHGLPGICLLLWLGQAKGEKLKDVAIKNTWEQAK